MGIGILFIWRAKCRFLLSIAGITMAVVIMFLEQGFFFSVLDSQARLAPLINGDLVVLHKDRTHLNKWSVLNKIHLYRADVLSGVEKAIPLYKRFMGLRNKETDQVKQILVYAFPPDSMPLNIGDAAEVLPKLRKPRTVLFDRKSRDIYGRIEADQDLELNDQLFRLAGFVDIGPNIISDGSVVMSDGTFLEKYPAAQPVMGIIQLNTEADLEFVRQQMKGMFPDLTVMTPLELAEREMKFTATSVPIGVVFGVGMMAGLVIGIVVSYQVLFNELNDLKPQYATLTAMGFSGWFLGRLVLEQALALCLLGFAFALPIVWYLFDLLGKQTSMVMVLDFQRGLAIFGLTVIMCMVSALMAQQSVIRADPADLY
ncbi:MAG: hypothetical protein LJE70_17870 [Chromatiaceae bacterium]|nr:hypothetical protein [Chromatiaceae bacterium]